MTITKKLSLCLSGLWDSKPSRNRRSNKMVVKNEVVSQEARDRRSSNSMIPDNMVVVKYEGVSQEARERRSNNTMISNSTVVIKDEGVLTPNLKIFTLTELRKATRGFRPEMMLGEEGFGTVFKGWIHENTCAPSEFGGGMAIDVKRLRPDSMQAFEEWQAEIKFLGKYSHPNLVKLLGCCWKDEELLLVYEYMQKGSLDNHLYKRLPWFVRLKVLIGAGRCLAFFHTAGVIFRDLYYIAG